MKMRGLGILGALSMALTPAGCGDEAPGDGGTGGVVLESGDGRYLGMMAEAEGAKASTAPLTGCPWSSTSRPVPRSCTPSRARSPRTTTWPQAVPTDDFGIADLPAFDGERGLEVTVQPTESGGYAVAETGDGYSGVLSPDERYVFVDGDGNGAVFHDVESGETHRFDPGLRTFRFGGWVDDQAFYGATSSRGGAELPAGRVRMVSSTATTGTCSPVSPGFRLPPEISLLFGTGVGPYFY